MKFTSLKFRVFSNNIIYLDVFHYLVFEYFMFRDYLSRYKLLPSVLENYLNNYLNVLQSVEILKKDDNNKLIPFNYKDELKVCDYYYLQNIDYLISNLCFADT